MVNNSDILKLTDEDVYFLLYLNKIKGLPFHQLEEQFSLSRDSVEKIMDGRSRKKCYLGYMAIEKHLKETA
ncbi:hypothetical protein A1A1_18032 [Planococcus antarcticus DSM 14505]|uniref:Uncharacterized protein n=1 Tax=Planococcus antarcticus DSM 14505 TaxID=1185653 RepID=A0AA87IIJ6_9BACL|nr:hypothetical protein [Planococcus antarcticus]EIM05089.1 hypothetical protein A1A1_18032 [Planococcus antarcticus DSM 14505]